MDEHTKTVLASLEHRAQQRDDLEAAWQAATGALEILLWCDEFSRAAALTEQLLRDLGQEGTDLDLQLMPFTTVFLAAEAYAGEPALPRLQAAKASLPSHTELGAHFGQVTDEIRASSVLELLSWPRPWNESGRPPGRQDRKLLERDWTTLTGLDRDALWDVAQRSNDFGLAERIAETLQAAPTRWPCVVWFAKWLVHDNQVDRAAEVLRAGPQTYFSYAWWSLLPTEPPTDPDLRRALTDEVRAVYLTGIRDPFREPAL
ncbi:hypothetical protein [Saccharopolyspora phatthalungensis]|uniref:Uncharacterized protein n=1 Tax=Saccharopolyspora phatthalungensis TaxID=664693 RepID=A0A840QJV2_9PSEU|nr:hypothetical protein [Saccharopolyspora phatthalungensis]MBB5159678.1 hypothetical protein [Saccharopolyspora phatthalungensis]